MINFKALALTALTVTTLGAAAPEAQAFNRPDIYETNGSGTTWLVRPVGRTSIEVQANNIYEGYHQQFIFDCEANQVVKNDSIVGPVLPNSAAHRIGHGVCTDAKWVMQHFTF